jgi:hypothetical protein
MVKSSIMLSSTASTFSLLLTCSILIKTRTTSATSSDKEMALTPKWIMMRMKMKKKPKNKPSQEKHQPRRKRQAFSPKYKNAQTSDVICLIIKAILYF